MSLEVKTDADGRITIDLGEVHVGTTTQLVAGDDGIVRAVTTAIPAPEPVAEPEAPAAAGLTDEELQAEIARRAEAASENQ